MPEVRLERAAATELDKLPLRIHGRMLKLFERLGDWPSISGVKALSGRLAGKYRLRTGDYRLQFRLEDGVVIVERIGKRDGFYDE